MPMASRQQILERKKAVYTAQNMKDSKIGTCLLRENAREVTLRDTHISKLNDERRRGQMHLEQQKKIFLKRRQQKQPEPTVLVLRPGSGLMPESLNSDERTVAEFSVPGYMRPLKTRIKTPTRLTTIDAFTRDAKRTKNLWELSDERSKPMFRSCTHPSAHLTTPDAFTLQQSIMLSNNEQEEIKRSEKMRDMLTQRAERYFPPSRTPSEADSFDTSVFVTQMSKLRTGSGKLDSKVKFVGLRTPSTKSADSRRGSSITRRSKKAIDLPLVPARRRAKNAVRGDQSTRRFADQEFDRKLRTFDSLTKAMTVDLQRMKYRNERLPSADAIEGALAQVA